MPKILAKIGAFNYWVSIRNGAFRFEGLRDNGMGIDIKEATNFLKRLRREYPKCFFRIEHKKENIKE